MEIILIYSHHVQLNKHEFLHIMFGCFSKNVFGTVCVCMSACCIRRCQQLGSEPIS